MRGGSAKGVTAAINAMVDPSMSRPRQNLSVSREHAGDAGLEHVREGMEPRLQIVLHAMYRLCNVFWRDYSHMVVKPMM